MFPVNRNAERLVIKFDCVMRRLPRAGSATTLPDQDAAELV
jgi:hypothetical protein